MLDQKLNGILDVAPWGVRQVNWENDANVLNDLLTFMSNAILTSAKQIF